MLEFIVLGHIPGTQFEITFNWVLLAVAILLISLELHLHSRALVEDNDEATVEASQTSQPHLA